MRPDRHAVVGPKKGLFALFDGPDGEVTGGKQIGGKQIAYAMMKSKRINAAVTAIAKFAFAGLKKIGGGMLDQMLHGNNAVENGIGVSLLGVMYLYGWIRGLSTSSGMCDDASTCNPFSIIATMAMSMLEVWMIVCTGVLILLMIDKLVIATLFKSNNPEKITFPDLSISIGIRIAFSWIFNLKLVLTLMLTWVITLSFSVVYLTWIELRGSKVDDRRLAVRNVYIFNLAVFVIMVVAQLWLDWWWKQP